MRGKILFTAAAALVIPQPALAQMNMPGMNMPGMHMPMPKKKAPAKKKPSAKKSAKAKAGVGNGTKKPTRRAAAAKKPAKPSRGHGMSGMPGMRMPAGHNMSNMPAMKMPHGQTVLHRQTKHGNPMPAGHDMPSMPGMTMPHGQTTPQGQNKPAMDMPPGHDMSSMPGMSMPQGQATPGGQTMPGMSMQPGGTMPGMAMPQGQTMPRMQMAPGQPMNGMSMGADSEAAGTNLPAGSAPPPPVPTDRAADAVYGAPAMAMGRHHLQEFHGGQKFGLVLFNLAEYQARKGRDGYEWNAEAWYGGDIDRLWLKSEGDGTLGRSLDRAEIQALYSHAIGPYFNLQGGVRYDVRPNPSRVYATIGVEGLAPSFFELEGALFLSNKGELMARAEAYYDQRVTQRLILQPRAELNFAAQNSPEIGVGSGLSDAELGLRLRYDIRREFAPYVGVQYERSFGATRRYARLAGRDAGGWAFVAGIRTWF